MHSSGNVTHLLWTEKEAVVYIGHLHWYFYGTASQKQREEYYTEEKDSEISTAYKCYCILKIKHTAVRDTVSSCLWGKYVFISLIPCTRCLVVQSGCFSARLPDSLGEKIFEGEEGRVFQYHANQAFITDQVQINIDLNR